MHKFLLMAMLGTLTLATHASAQAEDGAKTKTAATSAFAALDRNGDGRLSRSEAGFDRVLSQSFAEIDTDGDGFVSLSEFAAAEKERNVTELSHR
jgi:Ca2+-binding EF-hand superfamily protein